MKVSCVHQLRNGSFKEVILPIKVSGSLLATSLNGFINKNENYLYKKNKIGTFKLEDLTIYGEVGKTYFLIFTSDNLIFQNNSQFFTISKNEMIDSKNKNYFLFIPIYIKPCPFGYVSVINSDVHM